jgi:hypothetical protein
MNSPQRTNRQTDQDRLRLLLVALDASAGQLCRDGCADWQIAGQTGHVYADGAGFLLVVFIGSSRSWTAAKARLAFCRVTQDGDDEGTLRLDRLPSSTEAREIRRVLQIRKRRQDTPATLARLENFPGNRGISRPPARFEQPPARKCHPAAGLRRVAS